MIGILTETIGSPDPISIPFVTSKAMGRLEPLVADQTPVRLAHAAVHRVLDHREPGDPRLCLAVPGEGALRHLQDGASDEIQWGSEDHWTFTPHEMARVQEGLVARGVVTASEIPGAASTITPAGRGGGRGGNAGGGGTEVGAGRGGGRAESPLYAALTAPELRDPRGFVIPSDQPDFGTATKFVNTLMKTGITIHRAHRTLHRGRQDRIRRIRMS